MIWIIVSLYSLSLLYIFLFSLGQLQLTWIYWRNKKPQLPPSILINYPVVTIQLPVYNERYVVERLLEAVCRIDYPKSKLEIQVLDDSDDETTEIIKYEIETLRTQGHDIKLVQRETRDGFKAGALAQGLILAKGEFIAIFDADFVPQASFLKRSLLYFSETDIAAVQGRWGYLNGDYSLLTQLQAFGLNAHFSIEQGARNYAGSFINFNGTCGIWRKTAIEDAGGWSADTLTEDLDLSYRAQLKGWRLKYLEDVVTPSELPVIMSAIKSQQFRWNKGGAETARKIFWEVLRSDFPLMKKVHAFFHLFNSSIFICLLLASILSVPMVYIQSISPETHGLFVLSMIFLVGFLSIILFYWVAYRQFGLHPAKKFFVLFPSFLIVSMGLALHNGLAVAEGLLGFKSPFIRTPKFGIIKKGESWIANSYIVKALSGQTVVEGLLCLYFLFGIGLGIHLHHFGIILFHVMLTIGFGSVFIYSIRPNIRV